MTVFRTIIVTAALAIGLVVVSAAAGGADTGASPVALQADGEALFQTHCAGCHQADGSGVSGAIPPLAGNPSVADAAYVESVITGGLSGPLEVLGETYDAAMPPVALSGDDLAAVVGFVQTLGGEAPPPPPPPPPATGDADHGEDLFKGTGFVNGGASCQGCHAAGPISFRGGGGLGPDLTDVYNRLGGDAGLSAWLAAPASPTMRPIFGDKPLTEGEIADLTAFFASIVDETPAGGIDWLLVGGLGGLIVLIGFMALVVRRPKETYATRLRSEQ